MAVTIKDLAQELGLSPSTVSRALRDDDTISRETQKKVKLLAKKWKYKPNPFAMMLRGQRSNAIAIIVPKLNHFYFANVIDGVERCAQEVGFQTIVCQSDDRYGKEKEILESPFLGYVDGIIAAFAKDTSNFDHYDRFLDKGIPMIFIDRVCEDLDVPSVVTDDYSGIWDATQHLISGGRTKIAYLGVSDQLLFNEVRESAFRESLALQNIDCPAHWVKNCPQNTVEEGKKAALQLLDRPVADRPTAILANNDILALGIYEAAKALKISIPQELAVVGFGDLPFSEWLTPSLSTVKQNGEQLGKVAANYILKEISPNNPPTEDNNGFIIQTELLLRDSSQ